MMRATTNGQLIVQTNPLPYELTPLEVNEAAKAVALYYNKGEFVTQCFFTTPILGEISWVDGFITDADAYFREICTVGPNLFHITIDCGEGAILTKMCKDSKFWDLLTKVADTMPTEICYRRYMGIKNDMETFDFIASVEKKKFRVINSAFLENNVVELSNILILGDRIIALTNDKKVVWGKVTANHLYADAAMTVNYLDEVEKIGPVDLLKAVPNSEDVFLITSGKDIYQCNLWGDMVHFNTLDNKVKKINSIDFNHTRSILATNNGLYEIRVQELPNQVKATSLPRRISNNELYDDFKVAHYIDDPYILGVNPAMGVFAKNKEEKVLFF